MTKKGIFCKIRIKISDKYLDLLLNSATLLIDEKNTGKTTVLKKIIEYCYLKNYKVIVIDTATEHKEKSIIEYCKQNYEIDEVFTYKDIKSINNDFKILLIDASYYLEKSYNYKFLLRKYIRKMYINEIYKIINYYKNKNIIFIIDEVQISKKISKLVAQNNIRLIATVHKHLYNHKTTFAFNHIFGVESVYKNAVHSVLNKNIMCGNLTANFITKNSTIKNLFWFFDILNFFIKNKKQIKCFYFNSTLMNAYNSNQLPKKISEEITKYRKNRVLINKKVNLQKFLVLINSNCCAALLIEQSLTNSKSSTSHYIVAKSINNKLYFLNPHKNLLILEDWSVQQVLASNKLCGGFIIFVK